jgi:hypothetical protein
VSSDDREEHVEPFFRAQRCVESRVRIVCLDRAPKHASDFLHFGNLAHEGSRSAEKSPVARSLLRAHRLWRARLGSIRFAAGELDDDGELCFQVLLAIVASLADEAKVLADFVDGERR